MATPAAAPGPGPALTDHAWQRMTSRGISSEAIRMALTYGRRLHLRGALYHVVGRREIDRHRRHGLDLSPAEGVHVVCSLDGRIVTVYRNRSLRGLRPRRGPRRHA